MKAIQFTLSLPRYGITKALGKVWPGAYTSSLSLLRLVDIPEPDLPGEEWVKVRTAYAGICGTDLSTIRLHESPMLSVYTSFPFVLGHENTGRVHQAGSQSGFNEGERVVVDPLLPCCVRGMDPPCPRCQALEASTCDSFTLGALEPGLQMGGCASTGGSWSEHFLAHRSQVFRLPDSVPDNAAVLIDAFACSLRAVARSLPRDGDTVLIVGAGVMGLTTLAALRSLGSTARLLVLARHAFQAEMARSYGADEAVLATGREGYARQLADLLGGRLARPVLGDPVMLGGGADLVFDCVGNRGSMQDALRFTRSGGRIVLVGTASRLDGLDWTPVWLRELTVAGSVFSGYVTWEGQPVRAYQLAIDLAGEGKADLAPLLTHAFPLEQWRSAIRIATSKSSHRLIKAAFVFA